jgi:hypothetical protein
MLLSIKEIRMSMCGDGWTAFIMFKALKLCVATFIDLGHK